MVKMSNKLQFVEFAGSQQTEVCWTFNAQFLSSTLSILKFSKVNKGLIFQFCDLVFKHQRKTTMFENSKQ